MAATNKTPVTITVTGDVAAVTIHSPATGKTSSSSAFNYACPPSVVNNMTIHARMTNGKTYPLSEDSYTIDYHNGWFKLHDDAVFLFGGERVSLKRAIDENLVAGMNFHYPTPASSEMKAWRKKKKTPKKPWYQQFNRKKS